MDNYGKAIYNGEEYIIQSDLEFNGEDYEVYATKSGNIYKLFWADEDSFFDDEPPIDVLHIDICHD